MAKQNDQDHNAPSIDYSQWVRPNQFALSAEEKDLFEWFVLGTPAIGVSKRSSGFIQYAHLNTTLSAEAFFESLQDSDLEIKIHPSSSELRKEILRMQETSNVFWQDSELVLMVKGDNTDAINEIKGLSEYRNAENSALKDEQTQIVKRRFLNIDTLFRHIRNGLAHGQFFECQIKHKPGFFLFDINQYGEVSAVLSVTYSRLRRWHDSIERHARTANIAEREAR